MTAAASTIDLAAAGDVAGQYWRMVLAGLVVLAVLVAVRRVGVRRVAVAAAVAIGLGASVESAWTFAGRALDLSGVWRLVPAVLFESAAMATAARAVEHHRRHGSPGPYVRWVWGFAVVAGVAPALSAGTVAEAVFRLLIPLVAAAVWYGDYATAKRQQGATTWILTPRRIGIRLGLIEPGEQDIEHVHHEHRVRSLTVAAHRLHHGGILPRRVYAARLRRLALAADDEMVTETRRRVERVHRIAELTAPGSGTTSTPASDATPIVEPVASAVATSSTTRRTTPEATARRVAQARRRHPQATQAEIAKRVGVTLRTVQRHWSDTAPALRPGDGPPLAEPAAA